MIIDGMADEFMDTFGPALERFLEEQSIGEAEAARLLKIDRARLNTYTHGLADGKRRNASAEVLAKACSILGFRFEYEGYTIVALKNGAPVSIEEPQLHLEFSRQFDWAETKVGLGLKKRPKKVQLSVTLKAVS